MDILNRLVQVIGAVMTIRGLFGVFTGAQDFFSGRKNDNPNKMDNGIELIVPLDVYRNGDLIEFVNNPDGTVSIMLKNIEKISNQL